MNAVVWGVIFIVSVICFGILYAALRSGKDDEDCGVGK